VYHVCADIAELVRGSPRYQGTRRWPARGLAWAIDRLEAGLIAAPRARLVANGDELHRHFGGAAKGISVVSATLLDAEVASVKRERPAGAPFRILFVGYLRREKGIDTLLESCERLAAQGRSFELSVVGATEVEDQGMSEHIRSKVRELGQRVPVRFEGHRAFGPALFRSYADADVLALPSLSEGTPRVLVEARGFGCPVVATRVGGIPTSVTDEVDGLLVAPGDADGLTRALERMMTDRQLHGRLVAAGFARARRHTVEAFVGDLAAEVERAGAG
jgi:glycosyltransferase involved in cell wall biosynthesis